MKYSIKYRLIDKNPFELVEMPIIKLKIHLDDGDEELENFYLRDQLIQFLYYLEQENNLKRTTVTAKIKLTVFAHFN